MVRDFASTASRKEGCQNVHSFAITVGFETLGEKAPALLDTVTRDSMKQERVKISDLIQLLMVRIA
jgi:glycyl-tRNA synthetase (class II)